MFLPMALFTSTISDSLRPRTSRQYSLYLHLKLMRELPIVNRFRHTSRFKNLLTKDTNSQFVISATMKNMFHILLMLSLLYNCCVCDDPDNTNSDDDNNDIDDDDEDENEDEEGDMCSSTTTLTVSDRDINHLIKESFLFFDIKSLK